MFHRYGHSSESIMRAKHIASGQMYCTLPLRPLLLFLDFLLIFYLRHLVFLASYNFISFLGMSEPMSMMAKIHKKIWPNRK